MLAKQDRSPILPALGAGAVVILMIVLLRFQGRMFLCACGYFEIWTGDTCSSNNSQQLFDPYSFTHLLHGFLLFWFLALFPRLHTTWQVSLALLLEGAWEVFENTKFVIERYRSQTAALGYEGDTIVNSLGDLAWAFAGFLVARQLGIRGSLIVFALVELFLLLWIQDSLLLQIIMLVKPVEAIKSWQMCV